jgi:Cft2 family RNA processing exonuclease
MLFAGGINLCSLLQHLPSQSDPNLGQKHIKLSSPGNPYYKLVSETAFITGPLKFDFQWLNSLDISSIDVWCISSLDDIYLLPFLATHHGFKGKIFTTLPINQIGYYIIRDLHKVLQERDLASSTVQGEMWQENEFFDYYEEHFGLFVQEWVDIFTSEQIEQAFEKVIPLAYKQKYEYSQNYKTNDIISITPCCSGHSIGSCYWMIEY